MNKRQRFQKVLEKNPRLRRDLEEHLEREDSIFANLLPGGPFLPCRVPASQARYALVGSWNGGGGVLAWHLDERVARLDEAWINENGGTARLVPASEV